MRDPEEIYKSLKACATEHDCRNCGYADIDGSNCINELMRDALEYIKQLRGRHCRAGSQAKPSQAAMAKSKFIVLHERERPIYVRADMIEAILRKEEYTLVISRSNRMVSADELPEEILDRIMEVTT